MPNFMWDDDDEEDTEEGEPKTAPASRRTSTAKATSTAAAQKAGTATGTATGLKPPGITQVPTVATSTPAVTEQPSQLTMLLKKMQDVIGPLPSRENTLKWLQEKGEKVIKSKFDEKGMFNPRREEKPTFEIEWKKDF